jgi:hypothetical protein
MPHTPGPWDTGGISYADPKNPRMNVWSKAAPGMQSGMMIAKEASIDNARLIAAAPELLDALKSLRNEIVGQLGIAREQIRAAISTTNLRCIERRIEQAEAVIAKSEGRS